MKTRFFTFLLALLTTIIFLGRVKAAGTYTINVTQGYTLTANDVQAINVLGMQNVISLSSSGSDRILKNASGTTLFTFNSSTYKCSLPASVSSANSLTNAITLDAYTLSTMGASSMASYSSIAMKFPDPVAYAEYNTNSTLTFHYDHLRSTFSTTYLMNTGTNTPGWSGKNPETVTFDSNFANYRPTSCYKWFEDMTYLKTINGLDNLRTENVTNMSRMFRNTGLTSLTLRSYFNTSDVTDMSYMFYGCSNLTFLSIPGNFITTKVTNMNQMFYSCSSLTKLNLSNFYISSSTSTQSMLSVMPSLQELTLSTSLVNYLSSSACTNIGTDFYGNVDTPCALIYPTSAHLSNVQASSNYVKWNGGYFTCSSMKPYVLVNGPALTFFCDDYYAAKQGTSGFYDLNTGYYAPGWHDNHESITTVVFNSSFAYAKPTSCYKWFNE
ncbi:MAG: BspA family leucine-rich repeat surface protein [Bacteroidaceae bacterium]|nr:BspA family leucine-rich repeat surface protein [Bacteroidaceae bacterium]